MKWHSDFLSTKSELATANNNRVFAIFVQPGCDHFPLVARLSTTATLRWGNFFGTPWYRLLNRMNPFGNFRCLFIKSSIFHTLNWKPRGSLEFPMVQKVNFLEQNQWNILSKQKQSWRKLQPNHKLSTDTGLQFLSFCPMFLKCGFLVPFRELKDAKFQKLPGLRPMDPLQRLQLELVLLVL